jgi:hypothetical protein
MKICAEYLLLFLLKIKRNNEFEHQERVGSKKRCSEAALNRSISFIFF